MVSYLQGVHSCLQFLFCSNNRCSGLEGIVIKQKWEKGQNDIKRKLIFFKKFQIPKKEHVTAISALIYHMIMMICKGKCLYRDMYRRYIYTKKLGME